MSLKLKIPPPVQGLFWATIMWGASNVWPDFKFRFKGQNIIGLGLVSVGLAIELISVGAFFRNKTTVNPMKPEKASKLVITGLYRFSRNPMYLGLLTLLTGWAIILGNPFNVICLAAFVFGMNWLQIVPEEVRLARIFGQDYQDYKNRVRRWI